VIGSNSGVVKSTNALLNGCLYVQEGTSKVWSISSENIGLLALKDMASLKMLLAEKKIACLTKHLVSKSFRRLLLTQPVKKSTLVILEECGYGAHSRQLVCTASKEAMDSLTTSDISKLCELEDAKKLSHYAIDPSEAGGVGCLKKADKTLLVILKTPDGKQIIAKAVVQEKTRACGLRRYLELFYFSTNNTVPRDLCRRSLFEVNVVAGPTKGAQEVAMEMLGDAEYASSPISFELFEKKYLEFVDRYISASRCKFLQCKRSYKVLTHTNTHNHPRTHTHTHSPGFNKGVVIDRLRSDHVVYCLERVL